MKTWQTKQKTTNFGNILIMQPKIESSDWILLEKKNIYAFNFPVKRNISCEIRNDNTAYAKYDSVMHFRVQYNRHHKENFTNTMMSLGFVSLSFTIEFVFAALSKPTHMSFTVSFGFDFRTDKCTQILANYSAD